MVSSLREEREREKKKKKRLKARTNPRCDRLADENQNCIDFHRRIMQLNLSERHKCDSTSDLIFARSCPAGPRIVIPQNGRGELIKSDVKKDNVS